MYDYDYVPSLPFIVFLSRPLSVQPGWLPEEREECDDDEQVESAIQCWRFDELLATSEPTGEADGEVRVLLRCDMV